MSRRGARSTAEVVTTVQKKQEFAAQYRRDHGLQGAPALSLQEQLRRIAADTEPLNHDQLSAFYKQFGNANLALQRTYTRSAWHAITQSIYFAQPWRAAANNC